VKGESLDGAVLQERKERREIPEKWGHRGNPEREVLQVKRESPDGLVPQEKKGRKESPGAEVLQERKV
jgi:hypothetical protein